jgi:hypothetical protein
MSVQSQSQSRIDDHVIRQVRANKQARVRANEEPLYNVRANETGLRDDEWEAIDDELVNVAQERLSIVDVALELGLTRNLSLGTLTDSWENVSEFGEADVTMSAEAPASEDGIQYGGNGVPIPVVKKGMRVGRRQLLASRERGQQVQTDGVTAATRTVTERLEKLFAYGWDRDVDGYSLPGFMNHPDVDSATVPGSWSTDVQHVRPTIKNMISVLDVDNNYGAGETGYVLHLPPAENRIIADSIDPDGTGDLNLRQRIRNDFTEISRIERTAALKDGEAFMYKPTTETFKVGMAADLQTLEWESGSGMTSHVNVFAAMAPEIRSDIKGNVGVVKVTGI